MSNKNFGFLDALLILTLTLFAAKKIKEQPEEIKEDAKEIAKVGCNLIFLFFLICLILGFIASC